MIKALEPPRIDYPADGTVQPALRIVWRPVETMPLPDAPSPHLAGKTIVIVGGTDETAQRIAQTLAAGGARVHRFNEPPERAAVFVADLGGVDGIVDLNLEGRWGVADADAWPPALRQTVALLKAVYGPWVEETDANRIFYVAITFLGGGMGYDGNVSQTLGGTQPFGGIWAGLAKSLPREIPNCNVKVLDVAPEDHADLPGILARELYAWGLFEISYRAGTRYALSAAREEVAPPVLSLSPSDTLLMSGGSRGIGFALARALARNFGCRVIVTGRDEMPAGNEPWLHLDEAAFKDYGRDLLRSVPPGRTVAAVRNDIRRLERRRELFRHLGEAAAERLPIEYRVCDFTVREQVRALVVYSGEGLTGVIHNAGIDAPTRLPAKSLDAFVDIVGIKVTGFLNLLDAVREKPLKLFCNVGSLTGRWGGMIGEADYAAANDGLSRLGMWAAQNVSFPVKTICWPTWEKLGMITNYEVTLRYMAALHVEEGLYHWQRELLAGDSGEVTFMGPFGKAVLPALLKGYPPIYDLPNIRHSYTQYHYLGDVLEFRPFAGMRSRNRIPAKTAPCLLGEWTIDGVPALPVSVLLEYALSAGDWALPETGHSLRLQHIRDVRITLAALQCADPEFVFEKEARGAWRDGSWVVDVTLTREGADLARLQLVYGENEIAGEAQTICACGDAAHDLDPVPGLSWVGVLFPPARWRRGAGGAIAARVRPCPPVDLWATPYEPACRLPSGHLENILRAAPSGEAPPRQLVIAEIALFAEGGAWDAVVGNPAAGDWSVLDAGGRVGLHLRGVEWST